MESLGTIRFGNGLVNSTAGRVMGRTIPMKEVILQPDDNLLIDWLTALDYWPVEQQKRDG